MRSLLLFSLFVVLLSAALVPAQTAPDAAELTKLLNEFLAGASRSDYAIHDKFWAEDLIYTRSAGVRTNKAEIMRGRSTPPNPDAPKSVFTAEDIRIQQYGTTAVVAFQLVSMLSDTGGQLQVSRYLNTATFLKRKGKWQVVGYQATPMQRAEEDSKREVLAAEAAYWKAILGADHKAVERLTDSGFVWVHHNGEQNDRKKMLDDVTSGALKYSKLTTDKITVTVAGDTAIVRGVSDRQRQGQNPFTTFYTLVFTYRGGAWKAISLHTSRNV